MCRFELKETDEFIILASDGVFDVFDNETVVRIARSAPSPQDAADLLTSSAFHAGCVPLIRPTRVRLLAQRPPPPPFALLPIAFARSPPYPPR